MKRLILNRLHRDELPFVPEDQFENRSFGVIQVGRQSFNSIERASLPILGPVQSPYVGWSRPFESCVPVGDYELVLRNSPSKGNRWHLVNHDLGIYLEKDDAQRANDYARWSCMFHPANYWYNIIGCIGTGAAVSDFGNAMGSGGVKGYGVTSSGNSIAALEKYLEGTTTVQLSIRANQ